MRKQVAIIGGGPAGLMLADKLDKVKFDITIYDRNQALGRKFLVAGKGGLNITHSEELSILKTRYSDFSPLQKSLDFFDNQALISWLDELGIETFYGSSKRVFPIKKHKPVKVFSSILNHVLDQGVTVKNEHTWIGFNANKDLLFELKDNETLSIKADIVVFALGGGSWSVTGSKGEWLPYFEKVDVKTKSFEASNAGFAVNWKKSFIDEFEGEPLKNIELYYANETTKGELVISRFGLEGGPIYALSKPLREALNKKENPTIFINFKPNMKREALVRKLKEPKKRNSWSEHIIWKLKLTKAVFQLMKRALTKEEFLNPEKIADILQKFPIQIEGIASVEEAISTVGGIDTKEIDEKFQLKKLPNHYVIGEMFDWDAPTGGYLLQGAFSMGAYLANELNSK